MKLKTVKKETQELILTISMEELIQMVRIQARRNASEHLPVIYLPDGPCKIQGTSGIHSLDLNPGAVLTLTWTQICEMAITNSAKVVDIPVSDPDDDEPDREE